ncbi:TetR/AcrR family transcriptional regulator [Elongatibacter sediminis]|uniref:TetR/AcrR family transcriptional regulator n=1 Tax=Elongatibacter sediminis TaxID=3119006 RepID=A0AAW9R946_9GAMM
MSARAAANGMERNQRSTLSAADWERAALELISEKGVQALAVEPLARRMGITKGSFYWHFSSRESLLEQALQRWEDHDSRNLNRSLGEIKDPRERLISFFRRVGKEKLTHEVYSELCAAAGHPQVEPVLERVANRRIAHLSAAFEELGLPETTAMHQARLTYSVYLGFLQLQRQHQTPQLSSEAFDAYIEHVIQTLIPGVQSESQR